MTKQLLFNDLINYSLILLSKGSNTRSFIDNLFLKRDLTLKPNMKLSSHSLVIDFSKMGFGIGFTTKEYVKKK